MAKFINKKEQVIELKLTSYGHYLMSVGSFKPTYYAFYDDNVIYDLRYAGGGTVYEAQNDAHDRIKNNTQYIEGLVLFKDVEDTIDNTTNSMLGYYEADVTPEMSTPRQDIFRFDTAIGDAYLDGNTNIAPAWQVVMLQGEISASSAKDVANEALVPQIDINAQYSLKTREPQFVYDPDSVRTLRGTTGTFYDKRQIELTAIDPIMYINEVNTQLLNENFEVEIFEVLTGSSGTELLRKYFRKDIPQIRDGFMLSPDARELSTQELSSGSVEYYFDFLTDGSTNQKIVCKSIEMLNKQSYYIDLDVDCEDEGETLFYDIYGSTTGEPEICLD